MNTILDEPYIKSISLLEENSKKHKALKRSFINELCNFLKNEETHFPIINGRFKFNLEFFSIYCEKITKAERDNTKLENEYYKNFARLLKYRLVHNRSANYPKALRLISINPNPKFFLSESYKYLDQFIHHKQKMVQDLNSCIDPLQNIYIYLRLFAKKTFNKRELALFKFENIITIKDNLIVVFIQEKDLFGFDTYQLHILDEEISKSIHHIKNNDGGIFSNIDQFEKPYNDYKIKHFSNVPYHHLKELNQLSLTYKSSVLKTLLDTNRIKTVRLTIDDILYLFPETVIPKHIIDFENNLKTLVYNEQYAKDDEEDTTSTLKDENVLDDENIEEPISSILNITDIESVVTYLKSDDIYISKTNFLQIKNEIDMLNKIEDDAHIYMITDYILYLITLNHSKKLRHSTVRNYLLILNKHIFGKIKDLSNIQQIEYQAISYKLNYSNYKSRTIQSYYKIISRFFKYCKKNHSLKINYSTFVYPKSLIYKNELQQILDYIETRYETNLLKQKNQAENQVIKLTKNDKFEILQQQMMILIGFYTGMRKNELRSRLLKDFHFDEETNVFNIYVNNDGLKKMHLKLKTNTSKRKISFQIDQEYLQYFHTWFASRQNIKNNNKYLFIAKDLYAYSSKKAIGENSIDILNEIIKRVTNRNCTLHSLRHSYITYQLYNQLKTPSKDPYTVLELSLKTGHVTPEITFSTYCHYQIIKLLMFFNKEDL